MRFGTIVITSIAVLLVLGTQALAQRVPPPESAAPPASGQPEAQTPALPSRPQVIMPDAEKTVLLLRNTLITLNDAIHTGNFTVLRDRAAPGFRDANSAARLGQIFSDLASRNVDLSLVSVISPQLTEAPILDQERGTLNLKGYFPSQPVQIDFEVLYQAVDNRWQVFGLSVQTAKPAEAQATSDDKNGATDDNAKP